MALKNFDKINREKREIQVGGEVADVTRIPSRVMLEIIKSYETGEISEDDAGGFDKLIEMISKITTPSNPKMTADFLIDHTDFETLFDVMWYVMEPARNKMQEVQTEQLKNIAAQAGKKKPKK